jgi:starch synthase
MLGGLARLLSGGRFDIVHGQSEGSFLVYCALALARLSGTPTVLTRHSVLATRPGLARPLAQLLARMLLPLADGVLAVSNAVAGERLGFRGPIHVVPNGVDPDEFRPIPDLRARTRHDLGFEDGHIVVGFTGRLHSNKGVELLVRAFESAGSAEPELRLLLVGPGPLCAVLESSESARQGRIRLLQAQPYDRVAGLLNAMDLFAFPSAREAFGISLLEAMACGLPSIAMGRLGVLDLAMDGVTGLLAHNEASFAAGLRRLASDASLRQEMGRKARERAATMFAWQRVAADTVRHYHELAERDAGRGE